MKTHFTRALALGFTLVAGATGNVSAPAYAQGTTGGAVMQFDGRTSIALSDGTQVVLHPALDSTVAKPKYYYLPTNLHLSQRPDGVPEFLFLKFTTEKREDAGGVQGALLHFLMEFSLNQKQKDELQAKLAAKVPNAVVLGAAPVVPDGDASTFRVQSATLSDTSLAKSVITSGKAPLVEGGKAAVASRLTGNGAQLLAATFDKARSITDVSMALDLAYYTQLPAIDGTITFHWSKFRQQRDSLEKEWTQKFQDRTKKGGVGLFGVNIVSWSSTSREVTEQSYKEKRRIYDFMIEKNIVKMDINQRGEGEAVNKVRDAFFETFLKGMEQMQQEVANEGKQDEDNKKGQTLGTAPGAAGSVQNYKVKQSLTNTQNYSRDKIYTLKLKVPVRQQLTLVGNLGSWYNAVRDNPKCVASVNLNDPFFSHRDVVFNLNLDDKDMFEQVVNYVTLNVRKKRSSGTPFQESRTINKAYVAEKGLTTSVTYARGEDKNPDVYEYQTQWSLKGGALFPKNPTWEKGNWEGVALTPPVKPQVIELQADPEEMKEKGIVRVAAQVHYLQAGEEQEKILAFTPTTAGTTLDKIFMDRNATSYAYRIIYYHNKKGRLAGEWVKDVSDGFIYANIPDNIAEDQSFSDRAKTLSTGAIERVLDKLGDLVDKKIDGLIP